jgi:hypothetical protein
MQDAYFQEKQDVGTWQEIGYSAPGTAKSNKSKYESKVFVYTGADKAEWVATPVAALIDCARENAADAWKLKATAEGTPKDVKIADNGTAPHCLELTASWSSLQKN